MQARQSRWLRLSPALLKAPSSQETSQKYLSKSCVLVLGHGLGLQDWPRSNGSATDMSTAGGMRNRKRSGPYGCWLAPSRIISRTCNLLLSPDHSVFVSDVLIPIKYLINGTTIMQVPMDQVTYYHVEFAEHDVLVANGLWVESYLAAGDRSNFENSGSCLRLFPSFSTRQWECSGCALLVVAGPKLRKVQHHIRLRSTVLDHGAAAEDSFRNHSRRRKRAQE